MIRSFANGLVRRFEPSGGGAGEPTQAPQPYRYALNGTGQDRVPPPVARVAAVWRTGQRWRRPLPLLRILSQGKPLNDVEACDLGFRKPLF
jgi:hypothetical protein